MIGYRGKLVRLAEMNRQIAFFKVSGTETDLIIAANIAIAARVLSMQLQAERSVTPAGLQLQI
jgi:hypothetical protein